MTRNDIATKLASQLKGQGMTPSLAIKAVNSIINIVSNSLKEGEAIYLRGFATIDTIERKAHNGYNFSSRSSIKIPARRVIRLTASKEFIHTLNSNKKQL